MSKSRRIKKASRARGQGYTISMPTPAHDFQGFYFVNGVCIAETQAETEYRLAKRNEAEFGAFIAKCRAVFAHGATDVTWDEAFDLEAITDPAEKAVILEAARELCR